MRTISRVPIAGATGRAGRHVVSAGVVHVSRAVGVDQDTRGALDAIKDNVNMPLDAEPDGVRSDLAELRTL